MQVKTEKIVAAPKHQLGTSHLPVFRHFTGHALRKLDKHGKGNVVYRFFNSRGQLLYVGVTKNLGARCSNHCTKPWWPEVAFVSIDNMFKSRKQAEFFEKQAIEREHPVYNCMHNVAVQDCSHPLTHKVYNPHRAVGLSSPAVAAIAGIGGD